MHTCDIQISLFAVRECSVLDIESIKQVLEEKVSMDGGRGSKKGKKAIKQRKRLSVSIFY